MSVPQRRSRLWREWALLTLLLCAFAGLTTHFRMLPRVNAAIYDSVLALWERPASADIVIVAIDDESLRQVGAWPWPRSVHATLLPRLAGARAVFLDVLLSENDAHPEHAALLAAALRAHGRVVLPVREVPATGDRSLVSLPLPELAEAAATLGHVHIDTDVDGLLRRVHLREGPGTRLWPHAALALWQLGQHHPAQPIGRIALPAALAAPAAWQREDEFPIAFVGGPGSHVRVPYAAVLRGDVPQDFFRDRFVLIGATAPGLGDLFSTPTDAGGKLMPGVEVSAHVLQQLQEGVHLRTASPRVTLALALAAVLGAMVANALLPSRSRLVATGLLALANVALAAAALRWLGLWVAPAAALFTTLAAYPLWSWRRLEAAQGFLDSELARLELALPRRRETPRLRGADPLEQRIAAIEHANDELQRQAKAREEAISFLSHDMRAPQVSILALVDTYRNRPEHLADGEFWSRLEAHARSTLSLAEDFVQINRAEYLDPGQAVPVELAALADEAIGDAWARLRAKNLHVQRRLADEAWVIGDRALLARAFGNLVDNAIKHAPPTTLITIGLEASGSAWRLWVADEGEGVPDGRKEAIFRRFETGAVRPAATGAGLGLALVRVVAERFGGHASVEDNDARGARFVIALPATLPPA